MIRWILNRQEELLNEDSGSILDDMPPEANLDPILESSPTPDEYRAIFGDE